MVICSRSMVVLLTYKKISVSLRFLELAPSTYNYLNLIFIE